MKEDYKSKIVNQIEITFYEAQVIKFIDLKKYSIKYCSKEMQISINEVNVLLSTARQKLATSLLEGIPIVILKEELKEEITTLCTFRCAICGEIYKINYTDSKILCPLCYSNKVMTNEEAGFCK